jgi:hypothetical protein
MARSSCAQTLYQHSRAPEKDPESGVRVRPDLVRQWVALSDPEIRYREEPPAWDRALLRARRGPPKGPLATRGSARWDLWTPPPPRVSSTQPAAVPSIVRSAPAEQAGRLGLVRSIWRKTPLGFVVGACDVLAIVIALVGMPVTLNEAPSGPDSIAVDTDFGWTQARTSAAMLADLQAAFGLAQAVPQSAEVLTVVAWADLPPAP